MQTETGYPRSPEILLLMQPRLSRKGRAWAKIDRDAEFVFMTREIRTTHGSRYPVNESNVHPRTCCMRNYTSAPHETFDDQCNGKHYGPLVSMSAEGVSMRCSFCNRNFVIAEKPSGKNSSTCKQECDWIYGPKEVSCRSCGYRGPKP
jgi:hypothetical protein